jgi:hypothetical protein
MKRALAIAVLLAVSAISAQANPWDLVPSTAPYKNVADAVQATSRPGQPSALNPSCAGMTGDQCVRSEQSADNYRPAPAQPAPPKDRQK